MSKRSLILRLLPIAIALLVVFGFFRPEQVKTPSDQPVPKADFEASGRLLRNNPGMKENPWYLVYELPGQPALSKELIFNKDSLCEDSGAMDCMNFNVENGTPAFLSGFDQGEQRVLVKTLSIVKEANLN
jgi:hypothetical protein